MRRKGTSGEPGQWQPEVAAATASRSGCGLAEMPLGYAEAVGRDASGSRGKTGDPRCPPAQGGRGVLADPRAPALLEGIDAASRAEHASRPIRNPSPSWPWRRGQEAEGTLHEKAGRSVSESQLTAKLLVR